MKNYAVAGSDEGKRLDRYLVERLGSSSRHGVKDMIDAGRVKVNGKRVVIAKWEMMEGDRVEVNLDNWVQREAAPRDELRRDRGSPPPRSERQPSFSKGPSRFYIDIVYEDRDVVVVEKPAGALIQAAGARTGESTYVDSLKAYLKRKYKGRGSYVKAVHRLDKETSGLMVFAKSKIGEKLIDQFKEHTVQRCYLAMVEGAVDKERGKIDLPIKKGDFGFGKKASVARGEEGALALTEYLVKERYRDATLLQLDLKTGRTHQARVHLAAIDHPIIGDTIYGRQGGIKFKRQALHSHILGFTHPATGKRMKFTSELPKDMQALVDEFREK